LAVLEFLNGQTDQAKTRSVNLLSSVPDEPGPLLLAGTVFLCAKDLTKAKEYFEKELAMTAPESGSYNQLAYIYAKLGRTNDSKKMLELNINEILIWLARGDEGPSSRMSLAISYKLQGDNEVANKWLRESVQAGWTDYRLAAVDPLYDGFRNDKEFRQIIDGVKARMSEMRKRAEELDKD
jgi:tetratricopeptide (TPR) repeat protein